MGGLDQPGGSSPPSGDLDRLDHVALVATDFEETIRWYEERFRCRVLYRDRTWALIEFENVRLALVTPGQHPPHIGFFRHDASRFGHLTPHRDGTRSTYVEDPSGNSVEILESNPASVPPGR